VEEKLINPHFSSFLLGPFSFLLISSPNQLMPIVAGPFNDGPQRRGSIKAPPLDSPRRLRSSKTSSATAAAAAATEEDALPLRRDIYRQQQQLKRWQLAAAAVVPLSRESSDSENQLPPRQINKQPTRSS
jgi:hypothetical protein